jgi:hypothetical protein
MGIQVEVIKDTEWEYYETRKPFYNILKQYCDFSYEVEQIRKYLSLTFKEIFYIIAFVPYTQTDMDV